MRGSDGRISYMREFARVTFPQGTGLPGSTLQLAVDGKAGGAAATLTYPTPASAGARQHRRQRIFSRFGHGQRAFGHGVVLRFAANYFLGSKMRQLVNEICFVVTLPSRASVFLTISCGRSKSPSSLPLVAVTETVLDGSGFAIEKCHHKSLRQVFSFFVASDLQDADHKSHGSHFSTDLHDHVVLDAITALQVGVAKVDLPAERMDFLVEQRPSPVLTSPSGSRCCTNDSSC